jgi:hypothetical protein
MSRLPNLWTSWVNASQVESADLSEILPLSTTRSMLVKMNFILDCWRLEKSTWARVERREACGLLYPQLADVLEAEVCDCCGRPGIRWVHYNFPLPHTRPTQPDLA